jgi:hypothetical protein
MNDALTLKASLTSLSKRRRGQGLDDAIELLQEGLISVKENVPAPSLEVADVEFTLASAYRENGNGERAIPLLHAALTTRAAKLEKGHPEIGAVKNALIALYAESGRRIPSSLYEF